MSLENRLELHAKLEEFLGSKEVYYQPPANVDMTYPAIVYTRDRISSEHANNHVYKTTTKYEVQLIGTDPDDDMPERLLETFDKYCSMDRQFISDGLYHWCFTLHYKN